MNDPALLPRTLEPFIRFAAVLRANRFLAAPDQTENFIAAVGLLGPRGFDDLHRAAVAIFAPPPERRSEFDALFRFVFLGHTLAAPSSAATDEDDVEAFDAGAGAMQPVELDEDREAGRQATAAERLATRNLAVTDETTALRTLHRRAANDLPQQHSRRWHRSKSGRRPDMRRALRAAVRCDGEVLVLASLRRRERQRRILLLIDVSGSMAAYTNGYLRFAHGLVRSGERVEAFTLGTRLTRVTRALKIRNRAQALRLTSTLVADWDGGTRLGDALRAFLDVPRFAAFARGAFVIVLSDGLERGDSNELTASVERLSRLAWSVLWLNPLAVDGRFTLETEALQAVLPFVDRLGPGDPPAQLVAEVLSFARRPVRANSEML